jgi:hypothetical protein
MVMNKIDRILVYGDSYVDGNWSENAWVNKVGHRLGVPVVNKAVGGSSTQYSMINFVRDIENYAIKDNDLIIFSVTQSSRIHFMHHNRYPNTAAYKFNYMHKQKHRSEYQWYYDNQTRLEWFFSNRDEFLDEVNHNCYIHFLRNFAESRPSITMLLLFNIFYEVDIPYSHCPENFLKPNISLYHASDNEFKSGRVFENITKYLDLDPRTNHFSNPNLEVLADLAIESINSGDITNYTYDRFNQKILDPISSVDQYMDYVNRGLLYKHQFIIDALMKNR